MLKFILGNSNIDWTIEMKNGNGNSKLDLFGKRIASIRKSKGMTQVELAKKIGSTQRVVAYYEGETQHIPSNLLVPIAKALKVSVDDLLGLKNKAVASTENPALWRKLKKAHLLPKKDQKAVTHYIEALLTQNKKS